ncbi:MAG: molybdopterin-binding protein, partial [Desulfuromonadales bacterium]
VERRFWKVDIKPGRPTAFGLKNGKPVFSLPGNPVSSMITFDQFVRPALLKMMGHQRVIKPLVRAVMTETFTKKPGRVQFLRVRVVNDGGRLLASSAGDQNTGILLTLLRANGIAVLPAELEQVNTGEEIDVHLIATVDEP